MKASALLLALATASSDEPVRSYYTYLGDITPAESSVGWGSFQVNRNWYMDGFQIDGVQYQTGVFAHAPSSLVYDLSSRFTQFTGYVGLDDGSAEHATFQAVDQACQNAKVVATVYVDGVIAGDPMILQRTKGKFIHPISVKLNQKQELRLTAQLLNKDKLNADTCKNNRGAEVAWVDAKLSEDPEIECMDLGDILPMSTSVGWGSYWVNKNWYQSGFMIGGIRYTTGVFAHAKSKIEYNLDEMTSGGERVWSDFSFCVGLDDHYNSESCKDANKGVHFEVGYGTKSTWSSKKAFKTGITRGQSAHCDKVSLYDKDSLTKTAKLTISAFSAVGNGNDMCQEAEWVNARVCMDRSKKDCEMSKWTNYGTCDRSCGSGIKTRTRSVIQYPKFGGKLCPRLDDIARCNEHACPIDCKYTKFTAWAALGARASCDRTCGGGHKYRYRTIFRRDNHGGAVCPSTIDKKSCNTQPCPVDCIWKVLSNDDPNDIQGWSIYSPCTKSCKSNGGSSGTQFRRREAGTPAKYGGKSCATTGMLKQVRYCNNWMCPVDCVTTNWSAFEECSVTCGVGVKFRNRKIMVVASNGGKGCGVTDELKECAQRKCPIDCEVSEWSAAHACSHSCGSFGTQIRHRSINIEPAHGGKLCPHLSETMECGADPCPVDCLVSTFGQWTTCSRSCGTGEHARRRTIRRNVEHGGVECPHLLEMRKCNKHECPVDCVMSAWSVSDKLWNTGSWLDSHCSTTCGGDGRAKRTRTIVTQHSHGGKPCALLETAMRKSCNTQACPSGCKMTKWSKWSKCTKSCNGKTGPGRKYRTRKVIEAAHFGGNACGTLNEEVMCTKLPDCPIDCDLSQWSDWAACDKTCGSGEQARTRQIFNTPKFGGKKCPTKLEEVRTCPNLSACPIDCKVGPWIAGKCDATCGMGLRKNTRKITRKGNKQGAACPALVISKPCAQGNRNCPIDCVYSQFSPFSVCSSACFDQKSAMPTKTRTRTVLVDGKNGGKKCDKSVDSLEQVEKCNELRPCAIDCKVGNWKNWGKCSRSCGHGIRLRTREAINTGNADGRACKSTVEAASCNMQPCPVDCAMTEWGEWDECTAKCGMGFQYRTRTILGPVVPLNGGKTCGEVQQMQYCNQQSCPVDCKEGKWSAWGACDAKCGRGQRKRTRRSAAPKFGGKACGSAYELKECTIKQCAIDCVPQAWGPYGECDKSCGAAMKTRHRAVKTIAQFGGKRCTMPMKQTTICVNTPSCPNSCQLSAWQSGVCKAKGNCGEGVQEWFATIIAFPRTCDKSMCKNGKCTTTRPCSLKKCTTDCKLSKWSAVNECSKSCGTGHQMTERTILVSPLNGGKKCGPLRSTRKCNAKPCPIDCAYGKWSDYGACSVSCASYGKMYRTRTIITQPKFGGAQCEAAKESKDCNMGPCPVHCAVSDWSDFSQCTKSCSNNGKASGEKVRHRQVVHRPTFGGGACPDLVQKVSCGKVRCPIDCEVGVFGAFYACDKKCGGGAKIRTRMITTGAKNGGRACPSGNGIECNEATGICTHTAACNQFTCRRTNGQPDDGRDDTYHNGFIREGLDWLPTIAPTKLSKFENGKFHNVGEVTAQDSQTELTGRPTAFPTAQPTVSPHMQYCMNGQWRVPVGWRGAGYGSNFCNLCKCTSINRGQSGHLQCQRKQCSKVKQGKVCSATACKFVYSFVVQREIMEVRHNTGKDVDGFQQEERNGSHHRCAYAVGSKIQDNKGSAKELQSAATANSPSSRNCVCLCYHNSYTQQAHPRLIDSYSKNPADFGHVKGHHWVNKDAQAHLDSKETNSHNNGQVAKDYYVNQWGVTTNYTKGEANHPTLYPTAFPTKLPTVEQEEATAVPTHMPTANPTNAPTNMPTASPTWNAGARKTAMSSEQKYLAEVTSNVNGFKSLPLGNELYALATKELNYYKSQTRTFTDSHGIVSKGFHTWRANLVRYNMIMKIAPELKTTLKNWNSNKQKIWVQAFITRMASTKIDSRYTCYKINTDSELLLANGGVPATTAVPQGCKFKVRNQEELSEAVLSAAHSTSGFTEDQTGSPTAYPTRQPTSITAKPTIPPTVKDDSTPFPTAFPTKRPTAFPTAYPTE